MDGEGEERRGIKEKEGGDSLGGKDKQGCAGRMSEGQMDERRWEAAEVSKK